MILREVLRKSAIPVYGVAAVWAVYCLFFPLYRTWHFIVLACSGALAYVVLSKLFPGKTEYFEIPKEPERTGNTEIDALLERGERDIAELRRLHGLISEVSVRNKLSEIITVTDKIFKNLLDDPDDYRQVKRFSEFFLPTTIKLLQTYESFGRSGVDGKNITGTIDRIDLVLDTILDSYKKFFDSLFENQALDIETDIKVLESILKKEGFAAGDF